MTDEQLLLAKHHVLRHPEHAAHIVQRRPMEQVIAVIAELDEQHAAQLVRHTPVAFAARVLQRLAVERAARLVHSLGVHTGVGILRQLGHARVESILNALPAATQLMYQMLLSYAADSVGGWMDNQAAALIEPHNVGEALKRLEETPDELASQVYVLDEEQHLLGVVSLPQLLRSKPKTALSELWRPFVHRLSARSSLSAVKAHPGWYESSILPVVDNQDRFLGVLHYSRISVPNATPSDSIGAEVLSDFMDTFWSTSTNILQGAVSAMLPRRGGAGKGEDA